MKKLRILALVFFLVSGSALGDPADRRWETLADQYLLEMPAFSPVGATAMGDHRFDGELAVGTDVCATVPLPGPGEELFILVRPLSPNTGSWGRDGDGQERLNVCP